jgi:hypothetical protein
MIAHECNKELFLKLYLCYFNIFYQISCIVIFFITFAPNFNKRLFSIFLIKFL